MGLGVTCQYAYMARHFKYGFTCRLTLIIIIIIIIIINRTNQSRQLIKIPGIHSGSHRYNRFRNRENNKRGKKSDCHVKLCLVEQNNPSQNQKSHVPGFSQKYITVWGRDMDTKHTTGEQITGN
jgi:hypothetical protein